MYPKGKRFYKEEIVRLWISQGLLPLDGDKRAEDIGKNYIKRLAERSMIHLEDSSFMHERFWVHDLVRDLAQHVAQDECLCVKDNKINAKKLQKRGLIEVRFWLLSHSVLS